MKTISCSNVIFCMWRDNLEIHKYKVANRRRSQSFFFFLKKLTVRRSHFFVICTGQPPYGKIMARKCSAESSRRATGIVEKEAIVLLFLYFSTTSASFLALVPMFFLRHGFLPSRFQHHYTWRSAVFVWIVSRKREKGKEKQRVKRRDEMEKERLGGWKERTIVDSPVVLDARETRHCGFMLLVHKFPREWRAYERVPAVLYPNFNPAIVTLPRVSSRFSRFSVPLLFPLLSFPYSSSFPLFPYSFGSSFYPGGRILLLRDRSYVYKSVTGHEGDDTRRNFRIYWSRGRLLPALLRRPISSDVLEKKVCYDGRRGTLCPINLRVVASIGKGNRAIGYARYKVISQELFV